MTTKQTRPSTSATKLLDELETLGKNFVPRDRELIERARGWIAWAYRENRRLVSEREQMEERLRIFG